MASLDSRISDGFAAVRVKLNSKAPLTGAIFPDDVVLSGSSYPTLYLRSNKTGNAAGGGVEIQKSDGTAIGSLGNYASGDNTIVLKATDGALELQGSAGTKVTGNLDVSGTIKQNGVQVATTATVQAALPPKGFTFSFPYVPLANEIIFDHFSPYAFTITPANCAFSTRKPATATTVLSIAKNGTQIGTATFAANATSATVAFTNTSIAVRDVITVVAPATPDATFAEFKGLVTS